VGGSSPSGPCAPFNPDFNYALIGATAFPDFTDTTAGVTTAGATTFYAGIIGDVGDYKDLTTSAFEFTIDVDSSYVNTVNVVVANSSFTAVQLAIGTTNSSNVTFGSQTLTWGTVDNTKPYKVSVYGKGGNVVAQVKHNGQTLVFDGEALADLNEVAFWGSSNVVIGRSLTFTAVTSNGSYEWNYPASTTDLCGEAITDMAELIVLDGMIDANGTNQDSHAAGPQNRESGSYQKFTDRNSNQINNNKSNGTETPNAFGGWNSLDVGQSDFIGRLDSENISANGYAQIGRVQAFSGGITNVSGMMVEYNRQSNRIAVIEYLSGSAFTRASGAGPSGAGPHVFFGVFDGLTTTVLDGDGNDIGISYTQPSSNDATTGQSVGLVQRRTSDETNYIAAYDTTDISEVYV